MQRGDQAENRRLTQLIGESGLTIYDALDRGDALFLDIEVVEDILRENLVGLDADYALRTRSKVIKKAVCSALGYSPPESFTRGGPDLPGQDLDVFVQKADNVQIWNQEIDPLRRYAFVRVDASNRVSAVRVIPGEALAKFDRTGTLTSKYQAKRRAGRSGSVLASERDTEQFIELLDPKDEVDPQILLTQSPVDRPEPGYVLTIDSIFQRLTNMIGREIRDPGLDQERRRGAILHELVCTTIGLGPYADAGQFPDILCQALEVKWQLAQTIDLGLVSPSDESPAEQVGEGIRHCDSRYAICYGERVSADLLRVEAVVVATGKDFFSEFQRFEGKVTNAKLQLPLPKDFFLEPE